MEKEIRNESSACLEVKKMTPACEVCRIQSIERRKECRRCFKVGRTKRFSPN